MVTIARLMLALCIALGAGGTPNSAAPTLAAQVKEFDFYPQFRRWWFALPDDQRQPLDAVLDRYRQRLQGEGVALDEVERRLTLIRTRRPELEADFWNRYFTVDAPAFNTAPNSFLVAQLQGRRPGRALDVGMGEGRNALYLAKLGWDVTGFDPADKAIELAQQRARELGLSLKTSVAHDRDFAFGSSEWDLVLFSYMPINQPALVIDALRPGGIVLFEGPRAWFPKHGLLKAFDDLRILHYEDAVAEGDFMPGQQLPIVRFVAERPLD